MDNEFIEKIEFNGYDTGLRVFNPKVFGDERGYFFETYNQKNWMITSDNSSINGQPFVQDNESCSSKGVMRGLHYQYAGSCQAKLVRVVNGSVIDFVLDIRTSSKSFGELFWFKLDSRKKNQLFVPKGFAHGFVSLEDNTIFAYKCNFYYDKLSERGINMLDPELKINERILIPNGIDINNLIISDKDKVHPNFKDQNDLF